MTYQELNRQVASLGFESEISDPTILLDAANRAVRQIFNERPIYRSLEIYQSSRLPASRIEAHRHIGSLCDVFPFNAKAYSFKTSGVGVYVITDPLGTKSVSFNEAQTSHRGFLHGEGKPPRHKRIKEEK